MSAFFRWLITGLDAGLARSGGRAALWGVLFLGVIGLAGLRFDKHARVVPAPPGDEVAYAEYVRYFRGHEAAVYPATSWRPLTPLLAAVLPARPETAINLVNVLALLAVVVVLYRVARRLGAGPGAAWTGAALFVFSFPTFYYGAIGYVDPPALLLTALGLAALLNGRWLLLALWIGLGAAAKETTLVLFGPIAVHLWHTQPRDRALALLIGLLAVFLAVTAVVRWNAPGPDGPLFWAPSSDLLDGNLGRGRAWLSGLLTFGLPGLAAVAVLVDRPLDLRAGRHAPIPWTLAAGMASAVAGWVFAFASAAVDGRTLWPLYVFAAPLVALALEQAQPQRIPADPGPPASGAQPSPDEPNPT